MAEIPFPLPDLAEGLIEATVPAWPAAEGNQTEHHQPLPKAPARRRARPAAAPAEG